MSNKKLIIVLSIIIILGFAAVYKFGIWYDENEDEQIAECNRYNGDFAPTGALAGASCLIDGTSIRYIDTINGWKLIINRDVFSEQGDGGNNGN